MKIRIGTRKSRLALAQTEMVRKTLENKFPEIEAETVHITTKGDRIFDKPLAEVGGKGVFISEIEQALLKREIDIAVHSAKDLPVKLADGLEISAVLKRGDPRDVLVLKRDKVLQNNSSFIIGTGSLRRRMFMHKLYPNVSFEEIRGNVDTRINKLISGEYDGIILSAAGIERLDISDEKINIVPFDISEFLPAPCQAIIAIECRKNDEILHYIHSISDRNTFISFEIERFILGRFGGDCGVPLGGYSNVNGKNIAMSSSINADRIFSISGSIDDRFELAERLVNEL